MAKQKPKDKVAPKGKQKGKGGGGKKPPGLVNRRQVQSGEVVRGRDGKKVNRQIAGKIDPKKGGIDRQVRVKGNLDRIKGLSFRDKDGKRVARSSAVTRKGDLRSGFTARWRNRMRTGTRNQEIVGGGSSG